MEATDGHADPDTLADAAEQRAAISVHQTSPDRVVFTEENNSDGWIATSLTLKLER